MAKGNPFWAKQTGKLGETVLAVVKGEQVQRAYNPEPVNPRSKGQTGQRIIFSSAVKFFKSAISKQFKFAFEDKKQKESDYNAFMRHNTKNGMIITRDQYLNPNFPSIGEYMLSKGSLQQLALYTPFSPGSDDVEIAFTGEFEDDPTKVSEVASDLAKKNNLLQGDIITFIHVESQANGLTVKPGTPPTWEVYQMKVGDADDRNVSDMPQWINVSTDALYLETNGMFAGASAIIVSRPTPSGLLVCDSKLLINDMALQIITASQDPTYKKEALASWGMETQAVLQGSLLPNS